MKIVVFDDDPTGSQTVHNCLLILRWDIDLLREGLRHPSPLIFILANTRALMPDAAAKRIREICFALRQAIKEEGIKEESILIVSRGDSTLRGHGVLEPKVISEEFGAFDATIHVPAFLEGGRTTVEGVHLLNGVPVHKTSFAKDRLFGYKTSYLPAWLEEKSCGSIHQQKVRRISIPQLDFAVMGDEGMCALESWLRALSENQYVVVDAQRPEHLEILGKVIRQIAPEKRFVFRAAASFINGLADVKSQLLEREVLKCATRKDSAGQALPGLVIVGSHVPLADDQLEYFLNESACHGVELEVLKFARICEVGDQDSLLVDYERHLLKELLKLVDIGKTPVLYTSRGEVLFSSAKLRLRFGLLLAQFMSRLCAHLAPKLGYLISKGGITTNTVLAEGLKLNAVRLDGQILPGLSIVRPLSNHPLHDLSIVTFPGNLGDFKTLYKAWQILESC